MTIPAEVFNEAVAVLGRTGSGKTFAAKGAIETLLARGERVVVLDPTGVWWGLRSSADGKKPGFAVAVFGGLHADVEIVEASGAPLAQLIADRNLPAVVDLSEFGMGARTRFATAFLEKLYHANRRPLTIVFDEADLFAPQRPMPDQNVMLNRVEQIARRGRVRGFRPWLITQRPAELHKSPLSQAGTLIAMRLTSPQDRDAVGAWIEGQADRAEGKKLLAALPQLDRGEGFLWCPAINVLERMRFPAITTFDSGRTPEHGEEIETPARLADVDLGGVLEALKPPAPPEDKKAKTGTSAEDIERARDAGYQDGYRTGLDHGAHKALAEARAALATVEKIFAGNEYTTPGTPGTPEGATEREAVPAPPAKPPAAANRTVPPGRIAEGISGPQQRLLDTLARLLTLGLTAPDKVTLAVFADVSEKSSSYANNLGALRTAGYIDYPSKGRVAIMDVGMAIANGPERPATTRELHAAWMRAVSAPQAVILRLLIEKYPHSIPRDELAAFAGVSSGSSAYANNLGRLRTMGAIDYPSKGAVVATPLLFPRKP